MKIGNREFDFAHHTYVMGILNVTPDSFSDGGRYDRMDDALKHVEEMISDGVDIIDIGGESTRPGYQEISVMEETERVGKVIEAVKSRFDVPVSIDTYKAPVMDAAFALGADMANDIWGLKYDSFFAEEGKKSVWEIGTMAEVIAKYEKPVCITHNRKEPVCDAFFREMFLDIEDSIKIAKNAGIKKDRIILDPGIGFGKTYEQNLATLAHLRTLRTLGFPLLLAASRKSVIGRALDLPVEEREEGTLVTTVLAAEHGLQIVRVHDVKKNIRAIQMVEKIKQMENSK